MSKYLESAKTAVSNQNELSESQKKQIESYEKEINLSLQAAKAALKAINEDLHKERLSIPDAIIARAEVEGETLKETTRLEQEIRKIDPSWISGAKDAIKMAMETSSILAEVGAEKVGATIGDVLSTPVSVVTRFWDNMKKSSSKRL